jgi:hypothetical protein
MRERKQGEKLRGRRYYTSVVSLVQIDRRL